MAQAKRVSMNVQFVMALDIVDTPAKMEIQQIWQLCLLIGNDTSVAFLFFDKNVPLCSLTKNCRGPPKKKKKKKAALTLTETSNVSVPSSPRMVFPNLPPTTVTTSTGKERKKTISTITTTSSGPSAESLK